MWLGYKSTCQVNLPPQIQGGVLIIGNGFVVCGLIFTTRYLMYKPRLSLLQGHAIFSTTWNNFFPSKLARFIAYFTGRYPVQWCRKSRVIFLL